MVEKRVDLLLKERITPGSVARPLWVKVLKINIGGFDLLQIKFMCYKFKDKVCLVLKDPV